MVKWAGVLCDGNPGCSLPLMKPASSSLDLSAHSNHPSTIGREEHCTGREAEFIERRTVGGTALRKSQTVEGAMLRDCHTEGRAVLREFSTVGRAVLKEWCTIGREVLMECILWELYWWSASLWEG